LQCLLDHAATFNKIEWPYKKRLAAQVEELLRRALSDPERGLADPPVVEDAALAMLAKRSGGDARVALAGLERSVESASDFPGSGSAAYLRGPHRHEPGGDTRFPRAQGAEVR